MEYIVCGLEVKVKLDENAIDNLLSEVEEWKEDYETITYEKRGDTILVFAWDMTSGDNRVLHEIEVNDYLYAEVYE